MGYTTTFRCTFLKFLLVSVKSKGIDARVVGVNDLSFCKCRVNRRAKYIKSYEIDCVYWQEF